MNESIQSNKSRTHLDARQRVMVILWVASVSTIGLYYVVSLFVPGPETDNNQGHVINIVLTLLGIFLAIISFVIKQRFIKQAEERQAPALVQTGLIVSLALCDSVGVLGLVDHFVTGNRYSFIMFVIALIATLFHFPRRDQLALASYQQVEPD